MTQALIAIGGIVGMMLLWVAVQALWKKVFVDYLTGEDAMGGRTKCAGCGCKTACVNKKSITRVGGED
ncbi:MAG: hypothetical protein ABJG41_18840 [Cyclobacteriaceae bacterium]